MMKRLSIRWRLTLWYGGVLAALLATFGTAVYLTMRHHQLERIDRGLAEELADVLSEVQRARDDRGLSEWLDRRFAHHEGFDFQITRPNGERFFVNSRLAEIRLPLPEERPASELPSYRDVLLDGIGHWRVVSMRVQGPSDLLPTRSSRLRTKSPERLRRMQSKLISGLFSWKRLFEITTGSTSCQGAFSSILGHLESIRPLRYPMATVTVCGWVSDCDSGAGPAVHGGSGTTWPSARKASGISQK